MASAVSSAPAASTTCHHERYSQQGYRCTFSESRSVCLLQNPRVLDVRVSVAPRVLREGGAVENSLSPGCFPRYGSWIANLERQERQQTQILAASRFDSVVKGEGRGGSGVGRVVEDDDDEEIWEEEEEVEEFEDGEQRSTKTVGGASDDTSSLTILEKKMLRTFAHQLGRKLIVQQVGKWGVTKTVVNALDEILEAHELVKVKVMENSPEDMEDAVEELREQLRAEVIEVIGGTCILYRASVTKLAKEEERRKMEEKKKKAAAGRRGMQEGSKKGWRQREGSFKRSGSFGKRKEKDDDARKTFARR